MGVAEEFVAEANAGYGPRPSPYFNEAMGALQKISAYVSARDVQAMRQDLERQIRAHPGTSIAIGFGVGMVLGKLLKR